MARRVAVFWPGDYRPKPNEDAFAGARVASFQMEAALRRLGCEPYAVGDFSSPAGFITMPGQSIARLGQIQDPAVAICTHWFYGPHTTDGMVGKENPLLLYSNWSPSAPGLVGLLNTGGCLESLGRPFSRIWSPTIDLATDDEFMARLEQWCSSGRITYRTDEIAYSTPVSLASRIQAMKVVDEIRRTRVLALMLGDTSMGMINGYLGPRLLNRVGFAEHKVDQAWLIHRLKTITDARVEEAFDFVVKMGVQFHWLSQGATDFNEQATKEQLRMYLAVLDLCNEFEAPCLGWQYQLGLLPLLPPSDFAEGLFNTNCRPEGNGEPIVCATEADQGNLIPMELMKRILKTTNKPCDTIFHDVRWGAVHGNHFLWVLLNSGSCSGYAFNLTQGSLEGVHSYRQPRGYFPVAGGTFAGESMPGTITWARAYDRNGVLWMDIGKGESIKLPSEVRDEWWNGTTREWPFMAADLGCSQETIMGQYFSNHVAVCYGDILAEMFVVCQELGFKVRVLSGSSAVGK